MNPSLTPIATAEPTGMPDFERNADRQSLDRTLVEIRSGRRLEKIVSSIQSFLLSQVTRLETALEECSRAVENDRIVQQILADFESEKQAWEVNRQAEILRLTAAGEELIRGWEQLENERRKWSDKLGSASTG
jgi:hypothetical protein